MSFWNIRVRKDGTAVIVVTEQLGTKPTQVIRAANKDLVLTDNYLEVNNKGQKLYLPFSAVWYPKTPIPYGILVAQGYLQKQPMNLLNMLYELFSLILYNNNPVTVNKLPIDVQALFDKYQKISDKFDCVDFAVIGNSIPLPY